MADSQVLKALLPDNPLCGISTYKDTLNLATGACTRQIKKVVFDGTEEWNYEVSVGYHNFYIATQYSDGVTSSKVVCSHQVSINAGGGEAENCWLSSTRRFNICIQQFGDSLTEFKAWLAAQYAAGTPVTFWYMLSSSTSETIPVPTGLTGTEEGYLMQSGTPSPSAPIYPTANTVNVWEHSLRKLTTATEAVENLLYSDGTAITAYTLKGNTVQNGSPTPDNPVDVNGVGVRTENIFNPNAVDTAKGYMENYRLNSGNPDTAVGNFITEYIAVIPDSTYTISGFKAGWSSSVVWYDSTFAKIGYQIYENKSINTFTVPSNAKYVRFTGDMNKKDTTMFNLGSTAKPFEPHGYKIPISSGGVTTNIYLGSTSSTRQIKKYEMTGNETITSVTQITVGYRFRVTVSMSDMSQDNRLMSICTHFQCVSDWTELGFTPSLNGAELFFMVSDISTSAAFTAYLQQQYANGTPVTIYYVLATPETAAVNEPLMKIGTYADTLSNAASIPTTEGANSITVDTTVQPSEFTATWTGWHDSSVQEYDGTNWQ